MTSTLVGLMVFHIQFQYGIRIPVAESHDMYPALEAYQESVEQRYRAGGYAFANFRPWRHVYSPAAGQLFPELRFARVRYFERPNPAAPERSPDLAAWTDVTIACDAKGDVAYRPYAHSRNDPFAALLVNHQIKIQTNRDAELVWHTFCDISGRHFTHKQQPFERISDREWHLGQGSYEEGVSSGRDFRTTTTVTYYTRVTIDPETGRITSWKSCSDTSNRRTILIDPVEETEDNRSD
ncbi:hypothetical protein [Thalassoroseus pseudoceratinae]|uniref:hypothetical protein n=1 Tax=Thalassoroseus pseudoceratinae TaxID=2713176 RepID=UPI00141DB0B7|nr:hypothetical protein [Thalassoroseus pseudoceratinae]